MSVTSRFFCSFLFAMVFITQSPFPAHAEDTKEESTVSNSLKKDPSQADQWGRFTIINENDYYVSNNDQHYTQGARLSYLSGAISSDGFWDRPFNWLAGFAPVFEGADRKRKYALLLGQSIFTPTNTALINPSIKDRPYAAWLNVGVNLLQESKHETHNTLENFEVLAGVVGRWALGGVTQNDFHQFMNVDTSLGWQNQLKNEPGVIISYARKWRFQQPIYGNFAADIIPELGASVGNIMTYGQSSLMVRLGQNLGADYGPSRMRPSLSGTDWFDADQLNGKFGWYVFTGVQGRAVARNIFLDGNSFASSPHVSKRPFVGDLTGGVSLFWGDAIKMDVSIVQRTSEFYGQSGHSDRFGGLNLTFLFW